MKKHITPFLTAMLLLLPVLYVGSYLVLVQPGRHEIVYLGSTGTLSRPNPYRIGGMAAAIVFAPIEYLDRQLRSREWRKEWYTPEQRDR